MDRVITDGEGRRDMTAAAVGRNCREGQERFFNIELLATVSQGSSALSTLL